MTHVRWKKPIKSFIGIYCTPTGQKISPKIIHVDFFLMKNQNDKTDEDKVELQSW